MTPLGHVNISCCHEGCYAVITLHPDEKARLRQTHEWFYCPAGHSQHFSGKTENEKRIADLERALKRSHSRADTDYEIRQRLIGAVKECPLGCGWRARRHTNDHTPWGYAGMVERVRADLADHLCAFHSAELPVPDDAEVPA